MKKLLMTALAVSAFSAAAVPAMAAPWQNINQRQAQLDQRIDVGVRNRSLTRSEAIRLRSEFNAIVRLEAQYRRTGGLQGWERNDLDRRFNILSAKIRYERHDRDDRRDGPGDRWRYDRDRDGHPDRSDRYPDNPRRW